MSEGWHLDRQGVRAMSHRACWINRLALLALALLVGAGCAPDAISFSYGDLPAGDAAPGAALFDRPVNGAAACSACHAAGTERRAGPPLAGYGQIAGARVPDEDPAVYTFYSIIRPSRYVVRGYSNTMPSDYDKRLSQQQIADLIAYLLTL